MALTQEKLDIMFSMQEAMNVKVNPDWNNSSYNWLRAIRMESAELIDQIGGWKWWKKQDLNLKEAQMELVDIWHFALSFFIENDMNSNSFHIDNLNKWYDETYYKQLSVSREDAIQTVENLISCSLHEENFGITYFVDLMSYLNLSWDDLFKMYIGKNVLNHFRQENGYKEGSYIKIWNGHEDNEVLNALLDKTELNTQEDIESLKMGLDIAYSSIVPYRSIIGEKNA